jgi:nitrate reductase delta subunit
VSVTVAPSNASVVFQLASLLLDYPQEATDDLAPLQAAVAELPNGEARAELGAFLDWSSATTPRAREETYVATFELNASACLYLTAHHAGDKRERGRRLLGLRDLYRSQGFEPSTRELPDYLPLVLEYAAAAPAGHHVLQRERAALEELRHCLAAHENPFEHVVAAVLSQLNGMRASPPQEGRRGR